MAAIAPYYISSPSTVDAQIGLNADLAGMLIDSCAFSAERSEVEHQNFAGVPTVLISNVPKFTATITAKVLARTAAVANYHPGVAMNKTYFTQYRSGTNNGFSTFRTLTSAAPLKRFSLGVFLLLDDDLPHSHECGPVEAKLDGSPCQCRCAPSALSRVRPR